MKKTLLQILCIALFLVGSSLIALHFYLLDGLDGWFFSAGDTPFEEDTVYAPDYSDKAFRSVKKGMEKQDVLRLLGMSFYESWSYEKPEQFWVYLTNNVVEDVSTSNKTLDLNLVHIREGTTKEYVLNELGPPLKESWVYSKTPGDKSYRRRVVVFQNGYVVGKEHGFYLD